jgi:hypothetical protein
MLYNCKYNILGVKCICIFFLLLCVMFYIFYFWLATITALGLTVLVYLEIISKRLWFHRGRGEVKGG